MSAGAFHSCGLRSDNSIECWGRENFEGAGTVFVPDGRFGAVTNGRFGACGLRVDDTISCWLWSDREQSTPLGGAFSAIAVGWAHWCGLRADTAIDCWVLERQDVGQADAPGGSFSSVTAGDYSLLRDPRRQHHRVLGQRHGW